MIGASTSRWTVFVPLLAAIALAATWGRSLPGAGVVVVVAAPMLLALTVVVGVLTVVPGRATLLQGGVHLALFSAFVFLAASP